MDRAQQKSHWKTPKDLGCENWSVSKKEDIMREREGWNLFYFPFLPSSHGNGCAPGTLWTSEFFPFLELLIFNSLQVIHLPKMIPWIFCISWHAEKLCQTDHSQSNFAFYAPLPSWHDLVLACWCQRSQNNCCTSTSSPFIDTDTLGRLFKIKSYCTIVKSRQNVLNTAQLHTTLGFEILPDTAASAF